MHRLSDYDYSLPEELIAAEPARRRDESRLLIVDRRSGDLLHRSIRDLPEFLRPGDCLVLNDTQVVPARLIGRRTATGGKWEGLFLNVTEDGLWRLIGQARGSMKPSESITLVRAHASDSGEEFSLTLVEREDGGIWRARPERPVDQFEVLRRFGTVPLPPYIRRKLAADLDWERYQTVYSRRPGAVAAPTAGLHFTPELLQACERKGIERTFVTLHVGIGTFRPISVDDLEQHRMHAEWCEVSQAAAQELRETRERGRRIVAVGTTSVRTLESAALSGAIQAFRGETDLFIRPPYEFRAVDALLTNFHLPRSTLLVLVSAFAGRDLIRRAYEEAIRERYRFFSYGDAMLIL